MFKLKEVFLEILQVFKTFKFKHNFSFILYTSEKSWLKFSNLYLQYFF